MPTPAANPLENALAWFASAPARWLGEAEGVAEWVWVVLQGDFADDPTTAQTITGGLISMIPLVDQLSDLRDLVANVRALREDENDPWRWVALALTLLGLFPTLGSPVKAGLKVVVAEARREVYRVGKVAYKGRNRLEGSKLWKETAASVERGIGRLDALLASAPMRKALAGLRIDEPYRYLSQEIRALASSLDTKSLRAAYDRALDALEWVLSRVQRWGASASSGAAGELLASLVRIRGRLNDGLALALEPLRHWLDCLARRLEVQGDMQYRAMVNARNGHLVVPTKMPVNRVVAAIRRVPGPVIRAADSANPGLLTAPQVPPGHFDISPSAKYPLTGVYATFSKRVVADVLRPGTRLVRVVDPQSTDNGVYWMLESEFKALRSKDAWRSRFAVWHHWNGNGEFVVYEVPSGPGLRVWRGPAASQELRDQSGKPVTDVGGEKLWLPGGAEQIAVHPLDLDPSFLSRRGKTGWGYANEVDDFVLAPIGVPELRNNLWEGKR
ncbi:hypothetical protein CKO44_02245 [Rubrivivax gelatinosus]|uniref:hypothetical protein n=1 Tax=Rubrivivax gelatinosus TaxID=28068 RepID=UPI001907B5EC|nr:hypothetical protein [Rubrivivax gelatinosus]MBK1612285.1 hypothetical protein [Rubrivivax gelatinosus]